MKPSPILLTGANGFVGSHIARGLIGKGHTVRALVRPTSDRSLVSDLPIEWIVGDLDATDVLQRAVGGVSHIIHCAGRVKAPNLEAYRHTNVTGTANLIEAASIHAGGLERFVYISSLAAGGPSEDGRFRREEDPSQPATPYGISKREGEELVLHEKDRLPVTVVRPAAVYGPGDTEVLAMFKTIRWHVKPVFGSRSVRASVVHVSDLAEAILLATFCPAGAGEMFHVAEDRAYDLDELETMIAEALDTWAVRVRFPAPIVMGIAAVSEWFASIFGVTPTFNRDKARDFMQREWTCSIEKAQRLLGFQPRVPFASGARQTVEWYRAKGWL